MRETTIVRRVDNLFENEGLATAKEVPLGPKRIDLVAVSPNSRRVVAVEAKVHDWRSGLRQALVYRLCAHHVYLAIDQRCSGNPDREILAGYGIGLISVDGQAEIVVKARTSKIVHVSLLEEVRDYVELCQRRKRGKGDVSS